MATVEDRYEAAVDYVLRSIRLVGSGYVGHIKTEPVRNELDRIELRWLRATNDIDRARVARDAELLADRTQESLPGAPQDRQRTNLYKGETPTSTPATSYAQEFSAQAGGAWDWFTSTAREAGDEAKSIGTWLLVGGGLLLGIKVVDLLRERARRERQADGRAINRQLEALANTTARP